MAQQDNINWDVVPGWRKNKIRSSISKLISSAETDEEKAVAESLLSDFNDVAPDNIQTLGKDLAISGKVAAETGVREVPRLIDSAINTTKYLTGGNKSKIPTSNLEAASRKLIPPIASDEEMRNRLLPKIAGGAVPYLAASAVTPEAVAARIPNAIKALAPLIPAKGLATNVAQGVVGGATESINRAVQQNQNPSLKDIATQGGASGALTAATILAGKGISAVGSKMAGAANKLVKKISKTGTSADDNAFIKKPGMMQQPIQEPLQGKVEMNDGLVPQEYQSKPLPKVQGIEPVPEHPLKGVVPESEYTTAPERQITGPEPVRVEEPEFKTQKPQLAPTEKESVVPRQSNIRQSKVNQAAEGLLDAEYQNGETYRQVFQSDNYSNEAKKQIFKTLMRKAEGRAINERQQTLKNIGFDNLDKENQNIVTRSLDEIDDLEHANQQLIAQGKQPSKLYNSRIQELHNDIMNINNKEHVTSRGTKQILNKAQRQSLNEPYKMGLKEQAFEKTKPYPSSMVVNRKNVLRKANIAVKKFVNRTEGSVNIGKLGQKVQEMTAFGKRIMDAKNWKQPLRVLEEKGFGTLEKGIRMLEERAKRFHTTVEMQYLREMADIPIGEDEYMGIAKVLDMEDSQALRDGTVNSLEWQKLSPNAKAWVNLMANFFHEAAELLGLPKERRLSAYITHIQDLDAELGKQITSNRKVGDPGFVKYRADGSELQSIDLPQIIIRYANGVRRKLLTEAIGDVTQDLATGKDIDPAFQQAYQYAKERNDTKLLSALEQVKDNLTKVYMPNDFDNLLTAGIRNYVEASIRNNASAGLLNLTQTPTLLAGEVGYPTYIKSVQLLTDAITGKNPLLKSFLQTIDFGNTSTARYDLQHGVFSGKDIVDTLTKYKEETDPKILIDAFGSIEQYINQPLAFIAGMLREVGDEKQLQSTLEEFSKAIQEGRLMEINDAIDGLRAAGSKVNESVNFVRTQANRPAYESAQNLKAVLPLLNYPIKEAGWVMDKAYELINNPEGSQGRMAALGALSNYLMMKGFIGGPKTVATLFIPSFAAGAMRQMAPEMYAQLEDSLTEIDDPGNIVKKITGRDYSDSIGLIDWSKPWSLQSPVFGGIKKAGAGIEKILNPEVSLADKGLAAADLAKFLPTGHINVGPFQIPLGVGQAKEIAQAAYNTNQGVRKVGNSEFPTSAGEEAARLLGPQSEDVAAYNLNDNRKAAKELIAKGVKPSKTQVREITRGRYGDEAATNRNMQGKIVKSLAEGRGKNLKEMYYRAQRIGDTARMNEIEDMAKDSGVKVTALTKYSKTHAKNIKKQGNKMPKGAAKLLR